MDKCDLGQIRQDLSDPKVGVRRRAIKLFSEKTGAKIVRLVEDSDAIAILSNALSDPDITVRRSAALGLRPWVKETPEILDKILPEYATDVFDGSYTHVGICDTRNGKIWIPRFAALKGHASLLADANTDLYFKFEFYIPNQIPAKLRKSSENNACGHILLYFILDWSYSQQCLIPDFDERRRKANRREQEKYADSVIDFYKNAGLPYKAIIHHLIIGKGGYPEYEFSVDSI